LTVSARKVTVIYDGECPICRNYSQALKIRESIGKLELVNARDGGPLVERIIDWGFDLDEGFVVIIGEQYYHGAEAIHRLALISGQSDLLNRFNFWMFKSPVRAKRLYPFMRFGRNSLLALLGKSKFSAG